MVAAPEIRDGYASISSQRVAGCQCLRIARLHQPDLGFPARRARMTSIAVVRGHPDCVKILAALRIQTSVLYIALDAAAARVNRAPLQNAADGTVPTLSVRRRPTVQQARYSRLRQSKIMIQNLISVNDACWKTAARGVAASTARRRANSVPSHGMASCNRYR